MICSSRVIIALLFSVTACALTERPVDQEQLSTAKTEYERIVDEQGEDDPIIGIWSGIVNISERATVAIVKSSSHPGQFRLTGVVIGGSNSFVSRGGLRNPLLRLNPTSIRGVYEGEALWCGLGSCTIWRPTRITLSDTDQLTAYHSTEFAPRGGNAQQFFRLSSAQAIPGQESGPRRNQKSQGTCFAVSPNGNLLTNYHVVEGAHEIWVTFPSGQKEQAKLEQPARTVDLALLRVNRKTDNYLSLVAAGSIAVGQHAFTVGFPAMQMLGTEPKYTDGAVSSLSGVGGEASFLQITVPVQPGNSGGPLVNDRGEVFGVITSTAPVIPFFKSTGALPQNVSWAVKSDYAIPLVGAQKPQVSASKEEAVKHALASVCYVEAIGK